MNQQLTQNSVETRSFFFLSQRKKITAWITKISTQYTNFLLRKRVQKYTLKEYSEMPPESLGYQFYAYITKNQIPFTPNLIRHDLKHILLNYEMTMPDELRIHAFLVGNGSSNLMSKLYLLLCLSITPEEIKIVRTDYRIGANRPSLKGIDLQDYARQNLTQLQLKFLQK